CGLIHTNLQIQIDEAHFKTGGWLYIDLHPDCSYFTNPRDKSFIKTYAARIPKLSIAGGRTLFAAVQFPVQYQQVAAPGEPAAPSMMDELQKEAAMYDDGYCKIIHSNQPLSNNLLDEESDPEKPVVTDIGIRLGWDDEQLLCWLNRQLSKDATLPGDQRADAPLGVFQYRVDVRNKTDDDSDPWKPLCRVAYKKQVALGDIMLSAIGTEMELGVEVYPVKLDADTTQPFWLPSYFAQWNGNSLVLPDMQAIEIYKKEQNENDSLIASEAGNGKKAQKNNLYDAAGLQDIQLKYGANYEFQVRMADTTGGGPGIKDPRKHDALKPICQQAFRRHVIPQHFRFLTPLPVKDFELFDQPQVTIARPLLGYPSVLYTGRYPNAIDLLKGDADAIVAGNLKRDIGLPDPNVQFAEVLVEVKGLHLDTTLPKRDPKNSFALLYKVKRAFPGGLNDSLSIPITWKDVNVLSFSGSDHLPLLGFEVNDEEDLKLRTDIVLPTSRDIKITIRPLCEELDDYYGGTILVDNVPVNRTTLTGMESFFLLRQDSLHEESLIKQTSEQEMIRGVYLQPEEPLTVRNNKVEVLVEKRVQDKKTPTLLDRLSQSIGCSSIGMSLIGNRGERWQFGCNRHIRNTLAPDSTSVTIGSQSDLVNHWLVPITLLMDRDWSWDGLKPTAFTIKRRQCFLRDAMTAMAIADRDDFLAKDLSEIFSAVAVQGISPESITGDIEIRQTINIQALQKTDRSQTHVCFIDAVEPKQADPTIFPDELLLKYTITPHFNHATLPSADMPVDLYLHLPITGNPAQVPKIVSAGLAFSSYKRDEDYANTETRKQYLWIEFDKAIEDPNDAYFARLLAYAPDPLLATWKPELFRVIQDPPLPIDEELIREIMPGQSDDGSGLTAMQEMMKATNRDNYYLLPLPEGLHESSPELFGFFTYEFRVGHKQAWTTAQARFGRALRNTGIQHAQPQLYAVTGRDERWLTVTAPFAQAVFDGRNITAAPPRTRLWALLYAQVRMADNSDNRNILLNDRKMVMKRDDVPKFQAMIEGSKFAREDSPAIGITAWTNQEVEALLDEHGLPKDNPLSVLCVELMPGYEQFMVNSDRITSIFRGNDNNNTRLNRAMLADTIPALAMERLLQLYGAILEENQASQSINDQDDNGYRPLTNDLGSARILRTSLLTAVAEVCCTV
ncbi:MAG TPA: hypothetical protein VLC28_04715, partial [Flavitalea sp.]|nr:hypothetical protein [Flavitalea sp.]